MGKATFKKPPFTLDRSRRGGLVAQLSDALRRAIETGYYRPGDVLPPVRDLAELLGVSKGMAERAIAVIREEGRISPRPHVGSVVCAPDRPLWKGHIVIVVPPGLGNPFDNMVQVTVRDGLTSAGYLVTSVTVVETHSGHFDDFSLLDTVLRQQTDLVVQLHEQDNIARWLSKRGLPFVRIAALEAACPMHCVGIVERRRDLALPDFVAHCREAGIRSILQVADTVRADAAKALSDDGVRVVTLRVPPALHYGSALSLSQWAMETFQKRLAKSRSWLPDLLFFQDDNIATGALLALGMARVRIPEDVRVATWANRDCAPVFTKPLARMEMDNKAAGATLAKCVLEYLSTGKFQQGVVVGPKYFRGETITP